MQRRLGCRHRHVLQCDELKSCHYGGSIHASLTVNQDILPVHEYWMSKLACSIKHVVILDIGSIFDAKV